MVGFDVMSHVALSESCWTHAGSTPVAAPGVCEQLWPGRMATTNGFGVCPGLGVSVITCLRRSERPRVGSEVHDGRWELVKKHVRGFLWCALVCAPSPVRIWIRLLKE